MLPQSEVRSLRAATCSTVCAVIAIWLFTTTIILATQFSSSPLNLNPYSVIIPSQRPTAQSHSTTSQTTMAFHQIPGLEDMKSGGDEFWETWQQTGKGGFLWVESPYPQPQQWGVSMFHALHCLKLIRTAVVESQNSSFHSIHGRNMQGAHSGHNRTSHHSHIPHCLGYIAQYILCAADGTLEPPKEKRDAKGFVMDSRVDGRGVEHQCRDASLLFELVERSEKNAIAPWPWKKGDSIQTVFGNNDYE